MRNADSNSSNVAEANEAATYGSLNIVQNIQQTDSITAVV